MTQAIRPSSIICARCGTEKVVGRRGPIPVYCSGACRSGTAHDIRIDINCAQCGGSASGRPGTIYCSPRCRNARSHQQARVDGRYDQALRAKREATRLRQAANARPCPYCSGPMLSPRTKQCGAPDCKRLFNADRMRDWSRAYRQEHGAWYAGLNYPGQQRAYEKRRRQEREHWRRLYPERAAEYDARRRALVEQARGTETFAPIDVHTRDEWTCKLCLQPIDPGVAWPDPMSPSVDHVIPLSRGGAHAMHNVQSAHLGCNSSKGDKLLIELVIAAGAQATAR